MTFFLLVLYGAAFKQELNCWPCGERVLLLLIERVQSLSLWFRWPHQKQKFGRRSYLKLTQCFSPFSMVMTLPRHNGRVISILTRTRIKYTPSSSTTLVDFCISPTMSRIPSETFVFMTLSLTLYIYIYTCTYPKENVSHNHTIELVIPRLNSRIYVVGSG